ncbi:MAG: peptidylprolyl isomerase [Caldisericia bacterium]
MGRQQKIKMERKMKEKEGFLDKGKLKNIILKSIAMFIIALIIIFGATYLIAYKDRDVEAKIGSTVIKKSELNARIEAVKNQYKSYGIDPNDPQYKSIFDSVVEQIKEEYINSAVVEEYAKRNNIKPTDDEIKQQVDKEIENIKSGFKSEEEYKKAVEASKYKTEEALREEIKKYVMPDILEAKSLAPIYSQIKVTDTDALNYFNEVTQVRARHILIKVDEGADEKTVNEKKALAEELRQRILKGEDFAKLAKEYSEDPGSKDNGGDLGFFSKGQMVKEFENAAFSLKPGEISEVIKTQYGFHIIQVLDTKIRGRSYDQPEKVKAKHILIKVDKTATQEDIKKKTDLVNEIYNKLLKGADFDSLAKEYSEDTDTKDKGGDLGEVSKGSKGDAWDSVVFALKKGTFSKPFESNDGYEIVYVYDKIPAVTATFESVKDEIIKTLETNKKNEARTTWLNERKTEYGVRYGNMWDDVTGFFNNKIFGPIKNFFTNLRKSIQSNSGTGTNTNQNNSNNQGENP